MAELCNVSPKEFNDCYLPVQWLEDTNNDGVPNKEELWVHPILLAINAYRQRLGKAPIDTVELAQTAVRYLQIPEEKRVKHPLLTEDIASRKRIISEFDLNSIPEGPYKTAVTELVKATSLSDLYYNLERNPDYLDLLDQVIATGDVTKIRHFWQNGGPICISSEDKACSSLPEAKFDPNGIWWPDEFTKKDADFLQKKYKWESEALKRKVLTPQSCIVSAKKGEEDSFKYKGKWYKVVSINSFPAVQTVADMMGEHLEKAGAALETEDPDFSYFLSQKAAYIRKGPIFGDLDLDKLWVDTNNRALAVFFGHAESYADRGLPLGMKSFMEGVVVYVDKSQQDIIDAGKSQVKQVDEILWQLWESKGEKFPAAKAHSVVPEVVVASKVVSNGGDANGAKYTPGGFVLPNYDNNESDVPREEQYHKTVFFGDVMARRVENQGLPVAKRAFDEESIKKVEAAAKDVRSNLIFTQLHEMNHGRAGTDDSVHYMESLKRNASLKELYGKDLSQSMEEAKADLLGLFELETYVNNGHLTEKEMEETYNGFLGNTLRDLYLGAGEEHGRGTTMEFYIASKYGVFPYNAETGKYSFDSAKLRENIPSIVKDYLNVYLSFDKAKAEKLDEEAQNFFKSSPLSGFIKELQKSGLPSDNYPYYIVKGDLGDF